MIKRDYVLFLFSIDYAEILRNWIRSSYKYFKRLMDLDDDAANKDRFLQKSLLRPVITVQHISYMRGCKVLNIGVINGFLRLLNLVPHTVAG